MYVYANRPRRAVDKNRLDRPDGEKGSVIIFYWYGDYIATDAIERLSVI